MVSIEYVLPLRRTSASDTSIWCSLAVASLHMVSLASGRAAGLCCLNHGLLAGTTRTLSGLSLSLR